MQRDKSEDPETLKKIRKLYSKHFPGINLHHPIPVSRIPGPANGDAAQANRMIVFPYNIDAHAAYHVLFWNLRIDQVWNKLAQIHHSIFETRENYIKQWWIQESGLESGIEREKRNFSRKKAQRLSERLDTAHFRNAWSRTFGGEDLATAENLLKVMMLFMIFGKKMTNQIKLFDDDYLETFFKSGKPTGGYCLWAFDTIFPKGGGSIQGSKSKIAGILRKNRTYYIKKTSE